MTEPRFFKRPQGMSAGEIAALAAAAPAPGAKLDRRITNIAPLDYAGPSDLAFLDNPRYAAQLGATAAGVCLIAKRFADQAPDHVTLLIAKEPYRAFVKVPRPLQVTKAKSRRNVPSEAMPYVPPAFDLASYFEGHFAITPFGSVWKPVEVSLPLNTTSASPLNVSGTIPV